MVPIIICFACRSVAQQKRLRSLLLAESEKGQSSLSVSGSSAVDEIASDQQQTTSSGEEQKDAPPEDRGLAVDGALREEVTRLAAENERIQRLCTSLHEKHRQSGLYVG